MKHQTSKPMSLRKSISQLFRCVNNNSQIADMADLVQWADQFGCFCTEVVSADKHRPQLLSPLLEVGHVRLGNAQMFQFTNILHTCTLEHEINSEKQRIHYQASQQDVVTVVPLDCISTQLYQPRHTYTYTACCKLYIYIYI